MMMDLVTLLSCSVCWLFSSGGVGGQDFRLPGHRDRFQVCGGGEWDYDIQRYDQSTCTHPILYSVHNIDRGRSRILLAMQFRLPLPLATGGAQESAAWNSIAGVHGGKSLNLPLLNTVGSSSQDMFHNHHQYGRRAQPIFTPMPSSPLVKILVSLLALSAVFPIACEWIYENRLCTFSLTYSASSLQSRIFWFSFVSKMVEGPNFGIRLG